MAEDNSSASSSTQSDVSTQHSEAETSLTSITSSNNSTITSRHQSKFNGEEPRSSSTMTDTDDTSVPAVGGFQNDNQPNDKTETASGNRSHNQHQTNAVHALEPTNDLQRAEDESSAAPDTNGANTNDSPLPLPPSVSQDAGTTTPSVHQPPVPYNNYPGGEHGPVLPPPDMVPLLRELKNSVDDQYYNAIALLPPLPTSLQIRDTARDQAPFRSLQSMQYIGQMEDRVRYLEDVLSEVQKWRFSTGKGDAVNTPGDQAQAGRADAPPPPIDPTGIPICEHKSLTRQRFLGGEDLARYLICTLPEDEEPYNYRNQVKQPPRETDAHETKIVSRMCIRSTFIIDFLAKRLPDAAPEVKTCIFIKPFKPFCLLDSDIREYAALLKVKAHEIQIAEQSGVNLDSSSVPNSHHDTDELRGYTEQLKDMVSAVQPCDVKLASAHFELLVRIMDNELSYHLLRHKVCRQYDPLKPPQISFSDLWHVFKPGHLVYQQTPNRQAFVVHNVNGGRRLFKQTTALPDPFAFPGDKVNATSTDLLAIQNQTWSSFELECVYLDTSKRDLVYKTMMVSIQYFSGLRDIKDLEVVPLELATEQEGKSCREYLLSRGLNYVELTQVPFAHRDYKGPSLQETSLEGTPLPREQINSQVIIDFEHAYLHTGETPVMSSRALSGESAVTEIPEAVNVPGLCPICNNCSVARLNCYDDAKLDQIEGKQVVVSLEEAPRNSATLSELQKIILPGHVYGYVLRNLKWYKLDVHLLQPPIKNTNFDDLILPPENRTLVESLVRSRRGQQSKSLSDVVRGKGEGIIVLLHGVPGTGKSSTAECVAESLGCPLFTVTCGNIGTDAPSVEKKLQEMFYMAQKWNCVMLLDEADVFLQERDATDIARNAVVSVFLRALEYFGGVLFLTTNKVGKFDEAFVSRIHQAIEYPKLSVEATLSIWEVNLRKLSETRREVKFDKDSLMRLAKRAFHKQESSEHRITWNGRQIRNAFQTALALAEHAVPLPDEAVNKPKAVVNLEARHFIQVLEVSDKFDHYLLETHHHLDQHVRAHRKQDRFDSRPRQTPNRPPPRTEPSLSYRSGYGSDNDDQEAAPFSNSKATSGYGQYREQHSSYSDRAGPPSHNGGYHRGGRVQQHDEQQITPARRENRRSAFGGELEDDY